MLRKIHVRRDALILLLSLISIFNIVLVTSTYGITWTKRIWRTYMLPAAKRSAIFFPGSRDAQYLNFISTVVPPDASLVIAPNALWFSSQNIMQFFLLPRSIVDCQCEITILNAVSQGTCAHCLQRPDYYIPAIGDFPPTEILNNQLDFLHYPEDTGWYHGIYVPKDSASFPNTASDQEDFYPGLAFTLDLLLMTALCILGLLFAGTILPRSDRIGAWSLALPIGGGLLSWCLFILSWIGIPLSLQTAGLIWTLLFLCIGLVRILMRDKDAPDSPTPESLSTSLGSMDRSYVLACAAIALLFIFATLLSVGRSYSTYDAMAIWSLKGYAIAEEGTIFAGRDWGGHGMAYPLNVSLLIGIFKLLDGDVLPGSKLLFPFFIGSLLLGIYRYWRRQNVRPKIAALGLLCLLSIPLVFIHATIGFVNLAFTTYLVLGALWSIEGIFKDDTKSLLIAGILLGFAGWTRPEGIGFSALVVAYLSIVSGIFRHKALRILPWLLPLLVISGVWLGFGINEMRGDQIGIVLQQFGEQIKIGDRNINPLWIILMYVLKQSVNLRLWGMAVPLITILLLAGRRRLGPRHNLQNFATITLAITTLLLPIGIFFVRSFSPPDLTTYLNINADRAFFPTVCLGVIAGLSAASTQNDLRALKSDNTHRRL